MPDKGSFDSPSLTLLGEGPYHPAQSRQTVESGSAAGNIIHDAHHAAWVVEHGVRELWTTDRDFTRLPGLRIRNPFEPSQVHETRVRDGNRPARRKCARSRRRT